MVKRATSISVRTEEGKPTEVTFSPRLKGKLSGMTYTVRTILDTWEYSSQWWGDDVVRMYWRLDCEELNIEIYLQDGKWFVENVWD